MKKNTLLLALLLTCTVVHAQVPDQSWWTFTYSEHAAGEQSLLDLRYLNESFPGKTVLSN